MPGPRSIPNMVWMSGRRKSKSASSVVLPARCASAKARFAAVSDFPSAGEALVTTTVNRLEALHVIEPRPQRAEFFHGRFVRPGGVNQQGIGGGAERNFFHQFQQACQICSHFERSYSRSSRSSCFGVGLDYRRSQFPGLLGAAECIMNSTHS